MKSEKICPSQDVRTYAPRDSKIFDKTLFDVILNAEAPADEL